MLLDYFLWGTLKNMVHREQITTPGNMKERIREVCITLGAETIQSAVSMLVNRLYHCINVNGYYFEHLRKFLLILNLQLDMTQSTFSRNEAKLFVNY
ncbi:hypothetical protein WH47_06902 [Habropoda laboriosa]|uniref:Uncharacterized protein n=1 Tax=Habropoda laboriosa TaxID=597456 RepID=A0A0L7QQG1_9HYME|nr:hypothetical protein WH47_06902 [Habropoda laboriosa]